MLTLLLFTSGVLLAQKTVSGKVTDEKGDPIANASVVVKGSTVGTTTNDAGNFTLSLPANAKTLIISAIGSVAKEVAIGTTTTFSVSLTSSASEEEEVIITGYGTKKRLEFVGASSKVTAKTIEQVPFGSFENILQGQAPGLYVASGSGQPGASARVNIRGVGSFSGNLSPLYILDGVPIEEGVFRSLNPNDFESVDILKDAAGAGIYGSRGANGVIVIKTKMGQAGRPRLSYRGMAGYSEAPTQKNLQMMNTAERLAYEGEILGPGLAPNPSALTGLPGWDYNPNNPRYQAQSAATKAIYDHLLDSISNINTDWADLMFRKAKFSQHEVNVSGGANGVNYFSSLSYYKQQGILFRSGLERYTYRGNLDIKRDRLTVNIRSSAGFSQLDNTESEAGVALANPIAAAYLELPYVRAFNNDGTTAVGAGKTAANAYDRLRTTTSRSNQFKGTFAITAQFDIWNGIAFRTTNGVDWRNTNSSRFINPNSFAGRSISLGAQGSYSEGNSENLNLISTTGFVYRGKFDKHEVSASAMMEAIRNRSRSNSFVGYIINPRILNSPAGITNGNTTAMPSTSGGKSLNGLYSTFGTVDYTYDNRYSFFGIVRRDAPSQVPKKNRNNVFLSGGVSWNLSGENFMKNQNIFQDARVRFSYGETGNVNGLTSNFGYISTYGAGNYADQPGIVPSSPGNADYKLESQVVTNLGLEFAVWKRRIRSTVELYDKQSRNLFLAQQISRTTGFTSLSTNIGRMSNKGIEYDVKVDVVKQNDFVITLGTNGAFLRNRIEDMGQITELAAGTGISRVGLPFGTHYAVGFLGVDPQTGNPIYADAEGKPTSVYSASNSLATFGTYLPKFTGGATLEASWKGFSVSALFVSIQGVKRFNNESFFYETTNSNTAYNKRVEMLTQTWRTPGQITNYQRIGTAREFSSKDIQDASFVRFRNLTVAYTFAPKSDKYFSSVRVWGQAQNLYTWTKWNGFDPEESNNIATYEFPNPRTFTIGLDVNF
ncbi:SusC/RagA family TonB-linked outer membrane protein [Terrimonas rubra]|uniref:SusC/RagA family TonB-linked outer membrane protein n=1 Tax=Terrimonas rubra TaxID=1035890 RepID=A0ABW6A3C6_9BACT